MAGVPVGLRTPDLAPDPDPGLAAVTTVAATEAATAADQVLAAFYLELARDSSRLP